MIWPFKQKAADDRDDPDSMDVDVLLARANAASPTGPAATEPTLTGATGGSFRIPVEDVFLISGRGLVVTGHVESGTVSVGLPVQVLRGTQVVTSAEIKGIEMFREVRDSATVGEHVGVLLGDLTRETVQAGDVLVG